MKVSWDDSSQYMEKNVPNHQPVINECILCIHIHADVYAHMLRSPIPGSPLYPHSFLERAFERPQDEKHCESATGGRVCLHELVHLWWNPRAVEDSTSWSGVLLNVTFVCISSSTHLTAAHRMRSSSLYTLPQLRLQKPILGDGKEQKLQQPKHG